MTSLHILRGTVHYCNHCTYSTAFETYDTVLYSNP